MDACFQFRRLFHVLVLFYLSHMQCEDGDFAVQSLIKQDFVDLARSRFSTGLNTVSVCMISHILPTAPRPRDQLHSCRIMPVIEFELKLELENFTKYKYSSTYRVRLCYQYLTIWIKCERLRLSVVAMGHFTAD